MPDDATMSFNELYSNETNENHLPSSKMKQQRWHGIPFSPLKQHATNIGIFIKCSECEKPRVVYSKNKSAPKLVRKFKSDVSDLLFVCGVTVAELGDFATLFIRQNQTCYTPVETLYYSACHIPCCCHCSQKQKLINDPGFRAICNRCKRFKKLEATKKGKSYKLHV